MSIIRNIFINRFLIICKDDTMKTSDRITITLIAWPYSNLPINLGYMHVRHIILWPQKMIYSWKWRFSRKLDYWHHFDWFVYVLNVSFFLLFFFLVLTDANPKEELSYELTNVWCNVSEIWEQRIKTKNLWIVFHL